jgi:hypothetical protein
MKSSLKHLKRVFSIFLIALLIIVSSVFTSPKPAFASSSFNPEILKHLDDNQILNQAEKTVCQAYLDDLHGIDSATWEAIKTGATSALTIGSAVGSAAGAGAGALAGYAGMASAVSQLGLGGATTAIAGMMGSNVAGAAATAVVTAAVGGPVVMGALITGGLSAASFGLYEAGKFALNKLVSSNDTELEKWAKNHCR